MVSRLGTGTSDFTYPNPLAWYSGDTRKNGASIFGSTKSMRPYGDPPDYTEANDDTIGEMMTFSEGYFKGVISGASDKVDFINWFAEDFSDPSLFVPVDSLFASLQVLYRAKFIGDTPVFSIKTYCPDIGNPSLIFPMPMGSSSDWTDVTITNEIPFSINVGGWIGINDTSGSVGTTYTYSQWKGGSGAISEKCFRSSSYVAFGSGFNIGSENSATTVYIDWIEASYYRNGIRTSFKKPL